MRRLTPLLFLLIIACVDPLNISVSGTNRRLVVDGLITNQPGPYQVKLYYSNPLSTSRLIPFDPVTNAQVAIFDDLNNQYSLTEIEPGLYETAADELTGEMGRGYYLYIKTSSGQEYQSDLQRINPSGQITNLYFEFQKSLDPGFDDQLKIYIDAKGEMEEDNLLRWRWTTIHKVKSNPELQTRSTPGGEVPAPEPCSGYIYRNRQLIKVGDCTCCICWSYNYSNGAYVSHNEYISESQFNKQYLGTIPVTSLHFYERYYLQVDQLSLSDAAYQFWSLMEKQQNANNDIFQPNAIKIRGNIKNINDAGEEVLGYFGVSGMVSKSVDIKLSDVPIDLPPKGPVQYSCLEFFENATTEKPPFW